MKIYGIDFTSSPKRTKSITCLECLLEGDLLQAGELKEWCNFREFEEALVQPGPWVAGIDFPFGQSRTFIQNIGWPQSWQGYVDYVSTLSPEEFEKELNGYKKHREYGDKEHRRATDVVAGSLSPQKLYGVPVGRMFYQGAPRLRKAGVTIPGLQQSTSQSPHRIVVEAYPGVLARTFIKGCPYKHDTKAKQTKEQHIARHALLDALHDDKKMCSCYGLHVRAQRCLADDPTGDQLDALLCSIQAAWAWMHRNKNFGAPDNMDSLEGWIADPLIQSQRW